MLLPRRRSGVLGQEDAVSMLTQRNPFNLRSTMKMLHGINNYYSLATSDDTISTSKCGEIKQINFLLKSRFHVFS